MNKRAVCVFGVSGVGKSALLQTISDILPDVVIARGSMILKEAFGVASYERLESISAPVKKQMLIDGMSTFVKNSASRTIIMDTHLVVPIWKSSDMVIEDMWDDAMLQLFHGFVYITAHPSVVAERRRMNNERTLRAMRSTSQMCAKDLELNAQRWDVVSIKMLYKKVVVNDQSLLSGAEKISAFIRGL